jgi:hypothetical protein
VTLEASPTEPRQSITLNSPSGGHRSSHIVTHIWSHSPPVTAHPLTPFVPLSFPGPSFHTLGPLVTSSTHRHPHQLTTSSSHIHHIPSLGHTVSLGHAGRNQKSISLIATIPKLRERILTKFSMLDTMRQTGFSSELQLGWYVDFPTARINILNHKKSQT